MSIKTDDSDEDTSVTDNEESVQGENLRTLTITSTEARHPPVEIFKEQVVGSKRKKFFVFRVLGTVPTLGCITNQASMESCVSSVHHLVPDISPRTLNLRSYQVDFSTGREPLKHSNVTHRLGSTKIRLPSTFMPRSLLPLNFQHS